MLGCTLMMKSGGTKKLVGGSELVAGLVYFKGNQSPVLSVLKPLLSVSLALSPRAGMDPRRRVQPSSHFLPTELNSTARVVSATREKSQHSTQAWSPNPFLVQHHALQCAG